MIRNLIEKLISCQEKDDMYVFDILYKNKEYRLQISNLMLNSYFDNDEEKVLCFKKYVGMIDLQSDYMGLIFLLLDEEYSVVIN